MQFMLSMDEALNIQIQIINILEHLVNEAVISQKKLGQVRVYKLISMKLKNIV